MGAAGYWGLLKCKGLCGLGPAPRYPEPGLHTLSSGKGSSAGALTEHRAVVSLDNGALSGLSTPPPSGVFSKTPRGRARWLCQSVVTRVTWPQGRDPVEPQDWIPEGQLARKSRTQAPSRPPGPAPPTPCSQATLTLCGVQAAGLEGAQGFLKGFWRAEPGNSAPDGFGSLTQTSP